MKLSEKDADLFYSLFHPLLVYVNNQAHAVDRDLKKEDVPRLSMKEIGKLRQHLYKNPELIESFIVENPFDFSEQQLSLVRDWKHFEKGKFFIFHYLKKYTIFLSTDEPPKAYGVNALRTPFEEMIGPFLPVIADAVLLPFKDMIIYDSILAPYPISIGGGMKKGLNADYQEAKSRFGIIASLPITTLKDRRSDTEKLRFYLKNKHSREQYWEKIDQLISKNDNMLTLYHQEMGKYHARTYGKIFRDIGLQNGWFAILDGQSIASGSTKRQAEKNVAQIVPREKQDFVYYYQYKGK
ncbi:MAG: hypothetical protein U9R21_01985 [Candidatus Thermoplasmatota archaeon]|nr:hypothetical protein [Candidatus Thermoplasmatota archaeon]